ncbi:hypothetical protein ACWED2_04555 [Amycolatopsis sp. NPDC005003]
MSITAPGLFPNPARFAEYYARPIEKQGDVDLLAQLRRRIKPLVKRRTKEQVAAELLECRTATSTARPGTGPPW